MSIYNENGDMIEFIPDYTYHIPDWVGLTTHEIHSTDYDDHVFNDYYINPKIQEKNKSIAPTLKTLSKKIYVSIPVLEMVLGSYKNELLKFKQLITIFRLYAFYGNLLKIVLAKDKYCKCGYKRKKSRKKTIKIYREFIDLKRKIGKEKAARIMIEKYLTKNENSVTIIDRGMK
jgi:hypothetical protein